MFTNLLFKRSIFGYILILFFYMFFFQNTLAQISITEAFPNLTFNNPVDIQSPDDNTNRLFVVEQSGIIKALENRSDVSDANVFLDITDEVLYGGEQGLLGLAFHPNFNNNGFFFVNYTADNPRRTIISRFKITADGNSADINSELTILEFNQPYSNHNGGQIAFGPDGYLYIGTGDGGSGGDPQNNAQNLSSLLGKILRINVDSFENGNNYAIPIDNPFNNNSVYRPEIYAYGLRNPWRFSFDSNNNLWVADVGQNKWEEVHIVELGKNYGWRIIEGSHCYNPSNNCDKTNLELPIIEYDHSSSGGYSITGGYVYEGTLVKSITNKYIFADFVTGNIWAYDKASNTNEFVLNFSGNISTFGIDRNKEIYFADHTSGKIYKFEDNLSGMKNSTVPSKLWLGQNYPNPFNPTTTIDYSIPKGPNGMSSIDSGIAKLDIFDIKGKKIKTLINKRLSPGYYSTKFEAKLYNSGIYFYRLSTNHKTVTRKMILLK